MRALAGESSISQSDSGVPMISTKTKLLAILEVLAVYGWSRFCLSSGPQRGLYNGKRKLSAGPTPAC